jgi:UDP:flavonoid glycosyltransferase YjiC (YdhE family)
MEGPGPDEGWEPPWPDGDVPLVHISMGTVPPDELALPVIQAALDVLADLPVHALVTLPGQADRPWRGSTAPDASVLRVPANARVSGYVRHAAMLPHVQLFITHAGLGSIGAALSFGVPMVCLPLIIEQPDNAAHVEAIGAGRALDPHASAAEIRDAVLGVLSDASYRETCTRIGARLARDGAGDQAVLELEQLLPG